MNMGRKLKLLGIVFGILLASLSFNYFQEIEQFKKVTGINIEVENIPLYKIDAVFDEDTMTLKGEERIIYRNNHNKSMEQIYFHLYPNAFKEEKHVPFEKDEVDKAYPNGFSQGWIEILAVKEHDQKVNYKIMGQSSTILRVTPAKAVPAGGEVEFLIHFQLKLPNAIGRMGYGENTVNIANWYPIIAVYDNNGWNLDPYYAIGDPFYSEVANYNISLTVPNEYKLASTGNIINKKEEKNKTTYKIQANAVRDFAVILSKYFDVKKDLVEDVEVISYSIAGKKGDKALQYGVDAVNIFNNLFGKYPYEQLSVVACDFFIGGMEYPNLVMVGQHLYDMEEDFLLEYVVAHEVAHQWWYSLVGNNQVEEPWLDEGLTEYSTLMYFEQKYGPHIKEQILEKMIEVQYQNYVDLKSNKKVGILRSIDSFDTSFEYSSIVYSRGALFMEELREYMGEEAFYSALKEYFENYKFKNATTRDFYNICRNSTERDMSALFKKWLETEME